MAEETNVQSTETQEPETTEAVDWEAKYKAMREHSREWERKAKANEGAAKELEQLREASLTEQERAIKRAETAEAELEKLRGEAQRRLDAQEMSETTGIPVSLLMHCADRADMETFASEWAAEHHVPAASPAPESRVVRGGEAAASTRDLFAEFVANFI